MQNKAPQIQPYHSHLSVSALVKDNWAHWIQTPLITDKVFTTTQTSYLYNLITVQPPRSRSTRSSSLFTVACRWIFGKVTRKNVIVSCTFSVFKFFLVYICLCNLVLYFFVPDHSCCYITFCILIRSQTKLTVSGLGLKFATDKVTHCMYFLKFL